MFMFQGLIYFMFMMTFYSKLSIPVVAVNDDAKFAEESAVKLYARTAFRTNFSTEIQNSFAACTEGDVGKFRGQCFRENTNMRGRILSDETERKTQRIAVLMRGESFRHSPNQHEHKTCTPASFLRQAFLLGQHINLFHYFEQIFALEVI